MLLIPCPWCGPRDETEFNFGGSAEHAMPPLDGAREAWHAFVHLRANPKGPHRELWYHTGCERWIAVARDTSDHRIIDARDAGAKQDT